MTAGGRLPATLVSGLGRLARPAPVKDTEKCELCGMPVSDEHRHLLELNERRILCACEPCLAMKSGLENYCPVGNRTLWLDDFVFPDELWAAFQLPRRLSDHGRDDGQTGPFRRPPTTLAGDEDKPVIAGGDHHRL